MRLAVFVVVCIAGTVLCNTFKTANYIAQNIFASQAANLTSVKARSRLECATVCSRKEASISFTFNKLSQFCYCSDSQFEKYLELGMRRKMHACLGNSGYQFEPKLDLCYRTEGTTLLNGNAAKSTCIAEGGHLVRVTNEAINDFVVSLVSVTEYKSAERFFIDGSDTKREGVWVYSNGENMEWFNWDPAVSYDGLTENCADVFRPSNFRWADVPCTGRPGGYVCQIDI